MVIEVGLLLAAYLALLQLLVSEASWASASRAWVVERMQVDHRLSSDELERVSVTLWMAERASAFRLGGAAAIVLLIALLPNYGTEAIVTLTVFALFYFGVIELIVASADDRAIAAEGRDGVPGNEPMAPRTR